MSWTHSSKAVALGVLLAVALGAAGTAAAISFQDESAPESAQTGDEVTIEVTMEDLYENNLPNNWTLQADSGLNDPDWTLVVMDAAGDEVERKDIATDSIQQQLSSEQNHVRVEITVEGEVPDLEGFNYNDVEAESVDGLKLSQVVEDGTSNLEGGSWTIHKYTEQSREARTAIEEAESAVEGTNNENAQQRLDEAIAFYDNGDFENAITAADEARDMGDSSDSSPPLPLIIGGVVVLVLVLGGGLYYWRQQQKPSSKLQ